MATVYRAYEPGLDRYVALKVLPDDSLDNETAVQRFKLEARAVARLVHPNIVPVHAFGIEEATRTPWMALQLVEGGSLANLLAQGRLNPRRAVGLLRGIASALDYAHGQGVLHRDVKPQNVLIAAGDHAYLADFGLARILEGSVALSAAGTVLGTPQYMAPEQALGEKLDPRCDIYALGIVAYEVLAGALPFQADTPLAVLMKHVREPIPIPAPERVPEALLRPVLKALAKERDHRWPTALSFVDALEEGAASPPAEQPTVSIAGALPVLRPPAPPTSPVPAPAAPTEVAARPALTRQPARPPAAEASAAIIGPRSRAALAVLAAAGLVIAGGIAGILRLWPREPEVAPTASVASTIPPSRPTAAPATTPSLPTAAPATTLPAPPSAPPPVAASPSPVTPPAPAVIQVRSNVAGASVTVGDADPMPVPAELRLDAGRHLIEVTKAGCEPARQWLQVAAGERRRVQIGLSCPTPAPVIAQATPEPTPSPRPVESTAATPPPARRAGEVRAFDDGPYVWVPAGAFMMGCTPGDSECEGDESPRHRVTLTRGYYMARTEVTLAQYRRSGRSMPRAPGFSQGQDHPIVNVTWHDADAYCKAIGGRLPTEAEWERAARGGHDDRRYPWGNALSRENGNFGADKCCGGLASGRDRWIETAPVGQFAPNDYGLFDMAGNVWEWTADSKRAYAASEATDPRESGSNRVLRGGSWSLTPGYLRVSVRNARGVGNGSVSLGIRCVRDAPP